MCTAVDLHVYSCAQHQLQAHQLQAPFSNVMWVMTPPPRNATRLSSPTKQAQEVHNRTVQQVTAAVDAMRLPPMDIPSSTEEVLLQRNVAAAAAPKH